MYVVNLQKEDELGSIFQTYLNLSFLFHRISCTEQSLGKRGALETCRLPLSTSLLAGFWKPEMPWFHQDETIQGEQTSLEKRIHVASDSGPCPSGGRISHSLTKASHGASGPA